MFGWSGDDFIVCYEHITTMSYLKIIKEHDWKYQQRFDMIYVYILGWMLGAIELNLVFCCC